MQGSFKKLSGAKDQLKKISSKPKINTDYQPKKIEHDEEGTIYKCSCCGKEYKVQKGNFPITNSILYESNGGYLTICKSCLERYYQQLVTFYSGNENHALERCCQICDWFYSPEVTAMIKTVAQGKTKISAYASKMNLVNVRDKGVTYLDTEKEKHAGKIVNVEDIDEVIETNDDEIDSFNVDKQTILFFGLGFSKEEYMFLQNQYDDWARRYECKTKAQEEIYKNISLAQLIANKALKKGNMKEYLDATKTLQELMGSAGVKPNQTDDSVFGEQNTFGTLIKKWEDEEPIGEPDEEWKDVDGIKRYMETWFLGHLCNLVDVENDAERAYKEEIEKYTVKPPVYDEDDDLSETSLLDKFASKKEKPDDETGE